jgi:hypothetical protein
MTERNIRSTPRLLLAAALGALIMLGGCTHRVQLEPIQIEPIYITLDINLKIDRELDSFFDFEEQTPPTAEPGSAETSDQGAPS